VPNLPRLGQPQVSKDNKLRVASLLDVAACEVDLEHLPDIDRATRGSELDHGL
jgi:hypothetical protein